MNPALIKQSTIFFKVLNFSAFTKDVDSKLFQSISPGGTLKNFFTTKGTLITKKLESLVKWNIFKVSKFSRHTCKTLIQSLRNTDLGVNRKSTKNSKHSVIVQKLCKGLNYDYYVIFNKYSRSHLLFPNTVSRKKVKLTKWFNA